MSLKAYISALAAMGLVAGMAALSASTIEAAEGGGAGADETSRSAESLVEALFLPSVAEPDASPQVEVITLNSLTAPPSRPADEAAYATTSASVLPEEAPMARVQAVPIQLEGMPMIRFAATEKGEETEEGASDDNAEPAPDSPEPEAASETPVPPAPRESRPEMKPVTREAKPIPVPVEGSSLTPAEQKTAPAPKYQGDPLRKPVTIEFREMDLSNVVALLAQQADINVIAGTDITGTVTASLKNIPLMEAMEVVLGMNGLGIVKEGSIYRIVSIDEAIAAKRTTRFVVLEKAKPDEMKKTLDTIALSYPDGQSISVAANPSTSVIVLVGPDERVQELEEIARQLDVAEPVIPTVTRAVKLNYAEPLGVRSVIEGILTKDIGVVEEDERGRHIVITDTPLVVEQVEALIKELDTPVKQVAIDAMIVDAVMRDASQTGVDWLMERIPSRNRRGEVIGNLQELALDTKLGNIGSDLLDAGVLSIGTLSRDWNFRADLAAEVQSRNAEILANPVIVTVENKPAQIQIVQEYPYQELTQSTDGGSVASTEFKPIGVTLEVTPRVTHENDIIVDVQTKQSSISGLSETGVPIEDKRQASTTLLTGNGRTIFIGGLRNVSDRIDISKLPVLGDIPIAKFLFSQNDVEKVNTELLVFMTCKVVEKELPELSPELRLRHDKLDSVPEVPDSQRALFRSITHPEEIRDPAWKWRRKK